MAKRTPEEVREITGGSVGRHELMAHYILELVKFPDYKPNDFTDMVKKIAANYVYGLSNMSDKQAIALRTHIQLYHRDTA